MSDDDNSNIVDFPINFTISPVQNKNISEQKTKDAHASLVSSMEEIFSSIKENDKMVGGVFLAFEEDGAVADWFAGSIAVSAVYLKLDRIKNDLISLLDNNEAE